ncbi:MAG: SDR family NAD(P)-dependent oxidoreductase [Halioglobus sp.]|nr:SDR family NAD(P)-dependent oxidoreductase [Halioglobus sp.]
MQSRRALITGASSGIGRAFARQLALQGYSITGVARREDKLRELMGELPGDQHRYLVADLSHDAGVQSVTEALAQDRFHLLVNNAGYSVFEPFSQSELALQQNILNVNCAAVVTLAHAFLQQAQRGDALINLASVVSYLPTPAQPMYSASKAFVASLSECLWVEQKERGVYVMGLCPGVTATEFISTASGGAADGSNLPSAVTQSAEEVVAEALVALNKRRKAIVVTGRANRAMLWMPRLLSRHRLISILAVAGDPKRML